MEKSVVAVKEWKAKKREISKDAEARKLAEEEKLAQLKDERRAKAKQRYEEWLRNHQPSPSPKPRNRPRTLSDIYSTSPSQTNLPPWSNETDIAYEKVKVLYTPFL